MTEMVLKFIRDQVVDLELEGRRLRLSPDRSFSGGNVPVLP